MIDFTIKVYATLVEKTVEKAVQLTKEDDEKTWTARDVEKAVFVSRHFHGSASGQKHSDKHMKANKDKSGEGKSYRMSTITMHVNIPNLFAIAEELTFLE